MLKRFHNPTKNVLTKVMWLFHISEATELTNIINKQCKTPCNGRKCHLWRNTSVTTARKAN